MSILAQLTDEIVVFFVRPYPEPHDQILITARKSALVIAYAKDRQDLLGGIGLHQIGTDAAIIEEFRNRSQRAEMRLKLVFWQAEKDNQLDRFVIQPTKKLDLFSRMYQTGANL